MCITSSAVVDVARTGPDCCVDRHRLRPGPHVWDRPRQECPVAPSAISPTTSCPDWCPLLRALLFPNLHTPEESGRALARLAVAPEAQGQSGLYYSEGLRGIRSSKASYDEAKQEDLWRWTVDTLADNDEERKLFDFADLAAVPS